MGIHEPTLLATLAAASLISGFIFAWLARWSQVIKRTAIQPTPQACAVNYHPLFPCRT